MDQGKIERDIMGAGVHVSTIVVPVDFWEALKKEAVDMGAATYQINSIEYTPVNMFLSVRVKVNPYVENHIVMLDHYDRIVGIIEWEEEDENQRS